MPRYFVEHDMPQAGDLIHIDIAVMADQIGLVQQELAPHFQWIHSMITADKLFCLYAARDQKVIQEYAQRCGLPVQRITEVVTMFNPTTHLPTEKPKHDDHDDPGFEGGLK